MVSSLQRFERFFERLMEGSVGRIFHTPVQPAEIGRRLERAMDANQMVTVDGIGVPNDYVVILNPDDLVQFADFATTLCHRMEDWLIDLAEERNYGFIDQVRVQLIGDESVPQRSINVQAFITELPDYDPVAQENIQKTEVYNVVEKTGNVPPKLIRIATGASAGDVLLVRKRLTTIGRAIDNDVILRDPEVSRHHAAIEYKDGVFEIVDQNSTNGTFVNGERVTRRQISDRDEIDIATVRIEWLPNDRPAGRS